MLLSLLLTTACVHLVGLAGRTAAQNLNLPLPSNASAYRSQYNSGCSVHYYDEQKLDHFSEDDTRVFSQRYMVCDEYAVGDDPPIILRIGGEQPEAYNDGLYVKEIYGDFANAIGAIFVDFEHRYYGESYPRIFPNASTENLKYLSSDQALEDLRQFLLYLKGVGKTNASDESTPPLQLKNSLTNSRIVVHSGSYPGALAAWAKLKLGDIIDGAISNSAPVAAQVDYRQLYSVVAEIVSNEEAGGSQACFDFWDDALYQLASSANTSFSGLPDQLRPCTLPADRDVIPEDGTSWAQRILSVALVPGFQMYLDYVSGPRVNGVRQWCEVAKKYRGSEQGVWSALTKASRAAYSDSNETCTSLGS